MYPIKIEKKDALAWLFDELKKSIRNNDPSRLNLFLQRIQNTPYIVNEETQMLQRQLVFSVGIKQEISDLKRAAIFFLSHVDEYFLRNFFLQAPKKTIYRMFMIFEEVDIENICCRIVRRNIWSALCVKKVFSEKEISLIREVVEKSNR